MAAPKRAPVTTHDLQGFKYLRVRGPLLDHLHAAGTERDRAGNRQLFSDQYATLLLWYCFSPIVTSLRSLQQVTTLAKVQARFGMRPTALGTLSDAAQVFDAALRQEVIVALGRRIPTGLNLSFEPSFALSWGNPNRGDLPWHISTRDPVPMPSSAIARRSRCLR
jgi:hypothetical protein